MDDNALSKLPHVARIAAERLGGKNYPQERVITIDNTVMTRIPNDPNRARWAVINEGANDIRVSNSPDIGASSGWILAALGGVISMDWAEDGEGVTYDIYMLAVGAPSNVRLREVIIK